MLLLEIKEMLKNARMDESDVGGSLDLKLSKFGSP